MPTNSEMQRVLEKVEFLFTRYSQERRATTQPYLLDVARNRVVDYVYNPEDDLIRETLMEHVGSLPVLAIELYPYIKNDEVDLGRALTMLAIHDIGELITHDKMTFAKLASDKDPEFDAALTLLDPRYHAIYDEAETKASMSAKFAKAIDKITPDILDYLTPADITKQRYKHFVGIEENQIIDLIVEHKRPYMLWNPFMTSFHIYLMEKLAEKLSRSTKPPM
jgi:hypothetical protein